MRPLLLSLFLLCIHVASAQNPTQTIRGIVRDKASKQLLIGASVEVLSTKQVSITDNEGAFLLEKVPVGRINLRVQYLGYEPLTLEDIILQSTKESYLEFELNEGQIALDQVVVNASKNAFEAVNASSTVSTRSLTAEETERIPAGANDPGRVALSYPGVQRGENDTENQIVVRGNSPAGILWRLEGIDIPNPNHFAVIGSSGGGITVFSAQLLARSDFSTGGFAAEYGNAFSGVFDIHFRQGNFFKSSNRFRLSLLGIDLSKEGPIQKGRSSYLVNYRYSTLGLLSSMGIYLVGERVTNDFQDLSFNLVFKSKNNKSVHTVFWHRRPEFRALQRVVAPLGRPRGQYGHPQTDLDLFTPVTSPSSKPWWPRQRDRQYDTLNRENRYRYDAVPGQPGQLGQPGDHLQPNLVRLFKSGPPTSTKPITRQRQHPARPNPVQNLKPFLNGGYHRRGPRRQRLQPLPSNSLYHYFSDTLGNYLNPETARKAGAHHPGGLLRLLLHHLDTRLVADSTRAKAATSASSEKLFSNTMLMKGTFHRDHLQPNLV